MHQTVGIDARLLELEDIRQIEPRIATDGIGIAVWEPRSGQADPDATTKAFATAARAGGVEVVTGVRVISIRTSGHRVTGVSTDHGDVATEHVVVATGYWSASLLAPLGIDLPITLTRHTIATIQRPDSFGAPHPIVSDRVLGSYYMPEGEHLTLVGTTGPDGSAVTDPEEQRIPANEGLELLAERFLTRFPSLEDAALAGGWTGVYDCSPDLQPFLGPVPGWDGLHIAAGFSGHGFKLSPVAGDLVASGIVGSPRPELAFFSLSRLAAHALITGANTYSVPTLG
jgi:sarcosine oxidase subunit beta